MSLLLLFSNDKWTALSGLEITVRCGLIRADWHIESQQGQPLVQIDVALVGSSITSAAGTLVADLDRVQALSGLVSTSAAGTLVAVFLVEQSGAESVGAAGILVPSSDVPLLGLESVSVSGLVTVESSSDLTLALTGEEMTAVAGLIGTDGGTSAGESQDDIWLMRRRKRIFWDGTSKKPKQKRDKYKNIEV